MMFLLLDSLCFMNDSKMMATLLCQDKRYKGGAKNNMRSVVLNASSRNPQPNSEQPWQRVTASSPDRAYSRHTGQDLMIQLFQQTHPALFTAKHNDLSHAFLSPLRSIGIAMVTD